MYIFGGKVDPQYTYEQAPEFKAIPQPCYRYTGQVFAMLNYSDKQY